MLKQNKPLSSNPFRNRNKQLKGVFIRKNYWKVKAYMSDFMANNWTDAAVV